MPRASLSMTAPRMRVSWTSCSAEPRAAAGDTDILTGIENITGGSGADRLVGDAAVNVIDGGAGQFRLPLIHSNKPGKRANMCSS